MSRELSSAVGAGLTASVHGQTGPSLLTELRSNDAPAAFLRSDGAQAITEEVLAGIVRLAQVCRSPIDGSGAGVTVPPPRLTEPPATAIFLP